MKILPGERIFAMHLVAAKVTEDFAGVDRQLKCI